MPTIKGTIENVVHKKSGQAQHGEWHLFEVTINGQKFRTFDSKFAQNIGQQGTWEYDEEQRTAPSGKSYTSRTIKSFQSKPKGFQPLMDNKMDNKLDAKITKGFGVIRGDIQKLKEKVETMEKQLEAMSNKLDTDKDKMEPETSPEHSDDDIPVY